MMVLYTPRGTKHKTLSSYMSTLKMRSEQTQKLFQCTVNNVRAFGIDAQDLSHYNEEDIYPFLQEWIEWNVGRGIASSSIRCYFNSLRSYLWYNGIKLDPVGIKQNLKFPKLLRESQLPITPEIMENILEASRPELRFHLLALVSSGMRVGELGQIRISNLDLAHENIAVRIPASITKTGRSRVTFFSKQVSSMIRYRIDIGKASDYVFAGRRRSDQFSNLVTKRFAAARKKTGMLKKYDHCKQNRYTIHVHSLRAYFITKANRIQFGLGHILAGHEFYMGQYNRYTVEELLDMYRHLDASVTFHKTYYSKPDS